MHGSKNIMRSGIIRYTDVMLRARPPTSCSRMWTSTVTILRVVVFGVLAARSNCGTRTRSRRVGRVGASDPP